MSNQVYVSLWSKYRPAIVQLMKASEEGPQAYKFFDHEFKMLNPKEKKGHSFTLKVVDGRAANNIKSSPTAQDLLYVLANSRSAAELMTANSFEFTLDKQFMLHVTRLTESESESEAESPEDQNVTPRSDEH